MLFGTFYVFGSRIWKQIQQKLTGTWIAGAVFLGATASCLAESHLPEWVLPGVWARLSLPHAGHQERGGLSGMCKLLPAQGLVMFVDTLVCFCAHKVKQLCHGGAVGRVSTCSVGAQTTCYVFENITDFSECLIPVFTCIGISFLVPTSVHACTYIFSMHVFVHA